MSTSGPGSTRARSALRSPRLHAVLWEAMLFEFINYQYYQTVLNSTLNAEQCPTLIQTHSTAPSITHSESSTPNFIR